MGISRRSFLGGLGATTAVTAAGLLVPRVYAQEPVTVSNTLPALTVEEEFAKVMNVGLSLEERLGALQRAAELDPQRHLELLDTNFIGDNEKRVKRLTAEQRATDATLLAQASVLEDARHIRHLYLHWASQTDHETTLDFTLNAARGFPDGREFYTQGNDELQFFTRMHGTESLGLLFERTKEKRLNDVLDTLVGTLNDPAEFVAVEGYRSLGKMLQVYEDNTLFRPKNAAKKEREILDTLWKTATTYGDLNDKHQRHTVEHAIWTYRDACGDYSPDSIQVRMNDEKNRRRQEELQLGLEKLPQTRRDALLTMLREEPIHSYVSQDWLGNVHARFKEVDPNAFSSKVRGVTLDATTNQHYHDKFFELLEPLRKIEPKMYHFVVFSVNQISIGNYAKSQTDQELHEIKIRKQSLESPPYFIGAGVVHESGHAYSSIANPLQRHNISHLEEEFAEQGVVHLNELWNRTNPTAHTMDIPSQLSFDRRYAEFMHILLDNKHWLLYR